MQIAGSSQGPPLRDQPSDGRGPLRAARQARRVRLGVSSGRWRRLPWCEPITPLFIEALQDCRGVVDVGADSGFYTQLVRQFARPDCRILALEPDPLKHQALQLELRHDDRATLLPIAACDRVTTLEMFKPRDASATLLAGAGPSYRVLGMPLDRLLADSPADVIKIDVEGAEAAVLEGLRGTLCRRRSVVFLEYHPWAEQVIPHSRVRISTLLRDCGYAAFHVRDGAECPTERLHGRLVFRPGERLAGQRSG